jgi:hypothetical protein
MSDDKCEINRYVCIANRVGYLGNENDETVFKLKTLGRVFHVTPEKYSCCYIFDKFLLVFRYAN